MAWPFRGHLEASAAATGLLRHSEEESRRIAIFRKERETKATRSGEAMAAPGCVSLFGAQRAAGGVRRELLCLLSGAGRGRRPGERLSSASFSESLAPR